VGPEDKARQEIDRQLEACGWSVQHYREMNISASLGVAVEYFQLKTGEVDYLLYVNGRAAGVIEAKAEGHTLTGVETQSAKYTDGLRDGLPHYHLPLPFAYESTGTVTQFTNNLAPDIREELLLLQRVGSGRSVFSERNIRLIMLEPGWAEQRKLWLSLAIVPHVNDCL